MPAMTLIRYLLPSVAASALLLSAACTAPQPAAPQSATPQTAAPQKQAAEESPPSPLKLTVNTTAVASKFLAYVGGGSNISPPDTIGGGEGIPLISFSNNGPAFMAGEVRSSDAKAKLIKITFTVKNPAREPASFKIGDVRLDIGADRLNDFVAVGYDSKLCAMSGADRKAVKEIVVTVPPAGATRLSFAFPLFNPDSTRGELVLGSSSPVPFEIARTPGK